LSTLTQNIELFETSCRARLLSARTLEWYDWLLNTYRDYVEKHLLEWCDADTIDHFLARVAVGVSAHTVHGYYRALRRFFNWLEKRRKITENPMDMIDPPRRPRRFPRFIEAENVKKLLRSIDADTWQDRRDRAVILFLYDTGVRASELCELQLSNLETERKRILLKNGKGGKDRYVPLGKQAMGLLTDWLQVRGKANCGNVFIGRRGDKFQRRAITSLLRRRAKAAGIQGPIHPHAFRHGFAVAYLDNGGSIHNLQRLMGHATLRSTEIYLWSTDKRAQEDHEKASPGDNLK